MQAPLLCSPLVFFTPLSRIHHFFHADAESLERRHSFAHACRQPLELARELGDVVLLLVPLLVLAPEA